MGSGISWDLHLGTAKANYDQDKKMGPSRVMGLSASWGHFRVTHSYSYG